MADGNLVTKEECQLRCGAYKEAMTHLQKEIECYEKKYIELARWQAEHDGRINAWWKQQFRTNHGVDEKFRGVFERLVAVERKVIWASGFAAAIGAGLGVFGTFLLTRIWG